MKHSFFRLNRLRVLWKGKAVYDQRFHSGVNIIRGENGSGKSTIADFIFYILGGEFENWKTIAAKCEQVQAEILTQGGALTLRRDVGRAQTPIHVFFGSMADADQHGLDGWEVYPIRRLRDGRGESFSQIMFRASGIPEAQSQGASNITMHQILRLLYADQRTPAAFLFRYEGFDTREIREAVGDLICGLSVYEQYEIELALRDLGKLFDDRSRRLSAMLEALPSDQTPIRIEDIDAQLISYSREYDQLTYEIQNASNLVDPGATKGYARERAQAAANVRSMRENVHQAEESLHTINLEKADLESFIKYLEELSTKLPKASTASEIVGNVDFTHCPACLSELSSEKGLDHCVLCGKITDPDQERSRYLKIKMDIDIQIRESKQLLSEKGKSFAQIEGTLRAARRSYESALSSFAVKYDMSTSPQDSFVAQRYQRIGQIDVERSQLSKLRERAIKITALSTEKEELQRKINRLRERQEALELRSKTRRAQALTRISNIARAILKQDLPRQPEFQTANNVSINFGDNSILVDGELNFAESSNVIVKNAAILAILLAAAEDAAFYHPRFLLLDNIEDKGMEQIRSHNFQDIIIRLSKAAPLEHQIIFTTSMFNTKYDKKEYVIGPNYNHNHHTLDFGIHKESGGELT